MTRQDIDAAKDIIAYTLQHFLELDTESQTVLLACVMAFAEMIKPLYIEMKRLNGENSTNIYKSE